MNESGLDRIVAPKVLIAEDNDADYMLLLRQITRLLSPGSCTRVETRAELLSALAQPWDLIVTDYHLSDIEEDELLQTIALTHSGTPCLLLSGSTYELQGVAVPGNVFRILEKGDHAGLQAALTGHWQRERQ